MRICIYTLAKPAFFDLFSKSIQFSCLQKVFHVTKSRKVMKRGDGKTLTCPQSSS